MFFQFFFLIATTIADGLIKQIPEKITKLDPNKKKMLISNRSDSTIINNIIELDD